MALGAARPKRSVRPIASYVEAELSDDESEAGRRPRRAAPDPGPDPEPMVVELSEYERARLENIARNREKLAALGLSRARSAATADSSNSSASASDEDVDADGDDDDADDDGTTSSSDSDSYNAREVRARKAMHVGAGPSHAPAGRRPALAARGARASSTTDRKGASAGAVSRAGKRKGGAVPDQAGETPDTPIDLELHGEQARTLFGDIDTEGSGLLTVESILRAARGVQLSQIDERSARQMVEIFDEGGKGGLDVNDLMMILARPDMRSVFTA